MAANTSVYHPVPILRQPQTWACWYTSLQMVVRYMRANGWGAGLKDPSEDSEVQAIYDANRGVGNRPQEREWVASRLGFGVLYLSMTADGMWEYLSDSPVIYAGRWPGRTFGHWVAFVGISQDSLVINNPATGQETYDYNNFLTNVLEQTADRPLLHVP